MSLSVCLSVFLFLFLYTPLNQFHFIALSLFWIWYQFKYRMSTSLQPSLGYAQGSGLLQSISLCSLLLTQMCQYLPPYCGSTLREQDKAGTLGSHSPLNLKEFAFTSSSHLQGFTPDYFLLPKVFFLIFTTFLGIILKERLQENLISCWGKGMQKISSSHFNI